MGDAIWPEENFAMVFWCDEDEARRIERAVVAVKAQFPNEGIKLFGLGQSAPGQVYVAPQTPGQAPSAPDTAELSPSPVQALPYDPEDPNAE
jgi:hypothetical protein